jgi:hypothetical protein
MFNSNNTGWQWMHVNVQIVLVRCAGHAEETEETHNQKTELLVGLEC